MTFFFNLNMKKITKNTKLHKPRPGHTVDALINRSKRTINKIDSDDDESHYGPNKKSNRASYSNNFDKDDYYDDGYDDGDNAIIDGNKKYMLYYNILIMFVY